MTFLLLRFSGVTMLEKFMVSGEGGSQYQHYIQKVPSFLPFKRDALLHFVKVLIVLFILDYFSPGLIIQISKTRIEAFFRGALFGLILYAVYQFTNIALVKNWPLKMALVDLMWGSVLCGLTGFLTWKKSI